ncbi:phosphate/phosphite/phosphonate ABC transporter substrate-binding protein [Bacillus horti]|uniref:Phosphonate transport system substrate-binding protein n=1 Tax=Caldalkalibacillus horti TaxID=77523 RepID=A0ABT9VWN1_9BACI|nr:phosphate/phosphite/phosphonate ABC transporter substrate-binding protein [Bacillus horti]MDQ0165387.1 phosphonate transport system substrate-binding protein [Bacillus horti]
MWKRPYVRSYALIGACLALTISFTAYTLRENHSAMEQSEVVQDMELQHQSLERVAEIEPLELNVGIIRSPIQNEAEMAEQPLRQLETLLAEATSLEVEAITFDHYHSLLEALEYGQIQLAFLGPASYVAAHERSSAQAIAAMMVDEQAYHYSYIISLNEQPWDTLEEFMDGAQQRSFAFSGPFSTSGTLVPRLALSQFEAGRVSTAHTAQTENQPLALIDLGSNEATAIAIKNKEVDAGALNSLFFELFVEQGLLDEDRVKIIWSSDPLYFSPWVVSYQIGEELKGQLRSALVGIEEHEILNYFGATGFSSVTDRNYDLIRRAVEETGEFSDE